MQTIQFPSDNDPLWKFFPLMIWAFIKITIFYIIPLTSAAILAIFIVGIPIMFVLHALGLVSTDEGSRKSEKGRKQSISRDATKQEIKGTVVESAGKMVDERTRNQIEVEILEEMLRQRRARLEGLGKS